jgi:hypothetical protein
VGNLFPGEHIGENADHLRASDESGIGDRAHQANACSAVDKAHAGCGDGLAECGSFQKESRVIAVR